jgi:response regulator of citrate/malate metabolism
MGQAWISKTGELQLVVLETVFEALKQNEWSTASAAIQLNITVKTLRKYRRMLEEMGWDVEKWNGSARPRRRYKSPVRARK